MHRSIRPLRLVEVLAAVLGFAALVFAAPAMAAPSCPKSSTSHPFAKFGDNAAYTLLAGGSFESGTPGWSLSHAAVASGNESDNIVSGSHSLAIQPNGEAVSPAFCVNSEYPDFRFFARQTSGSWAVLNVIVRWTDSSGTHETTSGSLQSGTSWALSPVMKLGNMMPGQVTARLVFKPEPYGGAWAIDDVFVDPYSR